MAAAAAAEVPPDSGRQVEELDEALEMAPQKAATEARPKVAAGAGGAAAVAAIDEAAAWRAALFRGQGGPSQRPAPLVPLGVRFRTPGTVAGACGAQQYRGPPRR